MWSEEMKPGCPANKQASGVNELRGRGMESERGDRVSLGAYQLKSTQAG